jgi:hypothetical protein
MNPQKMDVKYTSFFMKVGLSVKIRGKNRVQSTVFQFLLANNGHGMSACLIFTWVLSHLDDL